MRVCSCSAHPTCNSVCIVSLSTGSGQHRTRTSGSFGHLELKTGKLLSLPQELPVVPTVDLPLGSILFFSSHNHVALSNNICRNYLFLPLPALTAPPCLSCMLHGKLFHKSFSSLPFLWQSDCLLLCIAQQSHSRSSQCFWIFLWTGIGKNKGKKTNKTEICILIKSLPLTIQKTVYEISCFLKNSLLKLFFVQRHSLSKVKKMKLLFSLGGFFHFSDERHFFHKSAFSVFSLKKTKKAPRPDQKSIHKPLLISQSVMYCDFWVSYPHAVFFKGHSSFWWASPYTYEKLENTWKQVLRLKSWFCYKLFVGRWYYMAKLNAANNLDLLEPCILSRHATYDFFPSCSFYRQGRKN